MASDPSVDPRALAELRDSLDDDDADAFVASLVSDYIEGAGSIVEQMRQAALMGDQQRWALAAHTLRGRSGTVGAQRVRSLCRQLETRPWPPDPTTIESELSELVEALREALAHLSARATAER